MELLSLIDLKAYQFFDIKILINLKHGLSVSSEFIVFLMFTIRSQLFFILNLMKIEKYYNSLWHHARIWKVLQFFPE